MKEVEPNIKNAEELLELIYKRTGRIPQVQRDIKDLFNENYQEEPL